MMRCLPSFIVTCLAARAAVAQELAPLVIVPLPFNIMLKMAYPDTNGFVAKATLEWPGPPGAHALSLPATIQGYGSKMSSSFSISDLEFIPSRFRELARTPLNEVRTTVDLSTRRIDAVFPAVHGYIEVPSTPKLEKVLDELQDTNSYFLRIPLGVETCEGFECRKVEIKDASSNYYAVVWERLDLNHFPMKIQVGLNGQGGSIRVHSVELVKPDRATLEVPRDFTKYSSSAEIVKAAASTPSSTKGAPGQTKDEEGPKQ